MLGTQETHLFAALAEAIAMSDKLLRALAACPGQATSNDRPMSMVTWATYLSAMHDSLADEMGVDVGKRLDLGSVDGSKSDFQN